MMLKVAMLLLYWFSKSTHDEELSGFTRANVVHSLTMEGVDQSETPGDQTCQVTSVLLLCSNIEPISKK